jgi:hypothetical protein
VKDLNNLSGSFISLSTQFQEVIEEWFESTPGGFDVFKRLEELEDQLDIQVSEALEAKNIFVKVKRCDKWVHKSTPLCSKC